MKLLSPLENDAKFWLNWIQARPTVTQKFGVDFKLDGEFVYKKMGLAGHNGVDFRAAIGTPIFAPVSGVARVKNDRDGYGNHVKIRDQFLKIEVILGHLSEIKIADGAEISVGENVGSSGNSGMSTGPHLHLGVREIEPNAAEIFAWQVKNYENGFLGYFDPLDQIVTWKGGLEKTSFEN